jgi:hypothetical protein
MKIKSLTRTGLICLIGLSHFPAKADSLQLEAQLNSGKLQLSWNATIGQSYKVQRTDDLTGTWSTIATVVADVANESWIDENALVTRHYYRLSYDEQPGNLLFELPDGGFESGTGWFQGTPIDNSPRIVSSAPPFTVTPRSGNHFAMLGGYLNLDPSTPNHQTVIQYNQPILLPLQPVYLHVWYQLLSEETDPFADVFNLWLADILATGPGCETNPLSPHV